MEGSPASPAADSGSLHLPSIPPEFSSPLCPSASSRLLTNASGAGAAFFAREGAQAVRFYLQAVSASAPAFPPREFRRSSRRLRTQPQNKQQSRSPELQAPRRHRCCCCTWSRGVSQTQRAAERREREGKQLFLGSMATKSGQKHCSEPTGFLWAVILRRHSSCGQREVLKVRIIFPGVTPLFQNGARISCRNEDCFVPCLQRGGGERSPPRGCIPVPRRCLHEAGTRGTCRRRRQASHLLRFPCDRRRTLGAFPPAFSPSTSGPYPRQQCSFWMIFSVCEPLQRTGCPGTGGTLRAPRHSCCSPGR